MVHTYGSPGPGVPAASLGARPCDGEEAVVPNPGVGTERSQARGGCRRPRRKGGLQPPCFPTGLRGQPRTFSGLRTCSLPGPRRRDAPSGLGHLCKSRLLACRPGVAR